MKTKFTMILTLFMALIVQVTFAQQQTVSGTVSDENGLPLIGATVVISGTSSGTTTDFDGNYRTNARQGEVLNFSYVGYESQNITVSISNTVNVSLQPDNTLDEVVITGVASGTSRTKLGFRVESVNLDGKGIQTIPTPDVASVLIGKVAGAQVVQGGGNP
ncbi:carboxypeptidase-like regulatory domain-containing protein [Flavobacteriaceae bacterium]|nr:carboxypeptidase-like regulatory domain-containing protein [Flavobacteriaceae bacterium]